MASPHDNSPRDTSPRDNSRPPSRHAGGSEFVQEDERFMPNNPLRGEPLGGNPPRGNPRSGKPLGAGGESVDYSVAKPIVAKPPAAAPTIERKRLPDPIPPRPTTHTTRPQAPPPQTSAAPVQRQETTQETTQPSTKPEVESNPMSDPLSPEMADPISDYGNPQQEGRGFRVTPLRLFALLSVAGAGYVGVWLHAYERGVSIGQTQLPPIVYAERGAEKILPPKLGGKAAKELEVTSIPRNGKETKKPPAVAKNRPPVARPTSPRAAATARSTARTTTAPTAPTAPAANKANQANKANKAKRNNIAPAQTKNGNYMIQLASLRDAESAVRRRTAIQGQVKMLGTYKLDIQPANLGERGIFYRVLVRGFASNNDATTLCKRLAAAGQDCLVKRQ